MRWSCRAPAPPETNLATGFRIGILANSSKILAKQLGQYTAAQQRWLKLIFAETEVLERELGRFKQARTNKGA
jgi:hypothetical protein